MPLFTILVAVYNAHDWLPRCLDSLLDQTIGTDNMQIICIDDCSTDDSAAIVARYAEQHSCVSLMRTASNSGQAVARNLGLAEAQGEFTIMVDADDWLAPDCLSLMADAHHAHPKADAIVARLVYWQEGHTWNYERTEALPTVMSGSDACRHCIDWTLHGYYAVSTELHRRYPYDTTCRLYSDDNTSRIHYLHSRQVVRSEGVYYYRQHPGNSTRQLTRRRFDFVAANDHLRALLEQEGVDAASLTICEDYVWRNYVGLWRQWQGPCSLSPEERQEVDAIFRQAFAAMQPQRLPRTTRRTPAFVPWRSYRLFTLWQRILMLRHHY